MSQQLNARAFTHGSDIYFNRGEYVPESSEGKRLLGHELTHVVQQRDAASSKDAQIQKKTTEDQSTFFKDCNKETTFRNGAYEELVQTLDRAKDFLDVAISKLEWDYTKYKIGASYRVAMARHFINPDTTEREKIRSNLRSMRGKLNPKVIRCTLSEEDVSYCYSIKSGIMGAFYKNNEIYLCPNFWMQNRNCRAIILIHEAAHAIGLGISVHPPYRGSVSYPYGSTVPVPAQEASIRIENPEAYAFFAAHIWREIDTSCIAFLNEIVIITGSAR
jgi:hypothetical protein